MRISPATPSDFEAIWPLFQRILSQGETYSYLDMTRQEAERYLMTAPGTHCFVATIDGQVAGCYTLRPNRHGRGDHVSNASYMVHERFRGRGVGKALGEHSIEQARALGFQAIQFNFVVSTNEVAVKLWQSLGFNIVGTLPKAFQHAAKGLVDVHVMHRFV